MANKTWRGDAQPIAQVMTITIGGTAGAGNLVTITDNLKDITLTLAGGETTTDVATALCALLVTASTTLGEFSRISFTSAANVVTATSSSAGYPFTITRTVTGTITATLATPTASSGPNHWDAVDNWGGSALPTTNDNIIVPADAPNYPMFGLDALSAVSLGIVTWLGGTGGLPDYNTDGYLEYRGKVILLGDADAINIGDGVNGTTFLRMDVAGTGTCLVKIDNGQALAASASNPGVFLTSSGSVSLTVTVDSGAVGIALGTGEVATVGALRVGTRGPDGSVGASDEDSAAAFGSDATVTATILYAGEIHADASTALTINGGIYLQRSGNIGAITNSGGAVIFNSNGTMGAIAQTGPDAVLDMSGDSRAVTSITSLSCLGGAHFFDPQKRLGNVAVVLDEQSAPLCNWGVTFTLTRS